MEERKRRESRKKNTEVQAYNRVQISQKNGYDFIP